MKKAPLYNYFICVILAVVSLFFFLQWYQNRTEILMIVGIISAVLFFVLLDLIIRGGIKPDPVLLKENENIIKEYTGIPVKKYSLMIWTTLYNMDVIVTNKRIYLNMGRRISSLSLVYNKSDLHLFSKYNSALINDTQMVNGEVLIGMKSSPIPLKLTWKIKNDANFIYNTIKKHGSLS